MPEAPAEKICSVTALTRSIRNNLLANNPKIANVWIEGEVSGNKCYSSGHRYFTLKDANAQITCILFSFCLNGCSPEYKALLAKGDEQVNGKRVQVLGELELNMGRGQYSFKVHRLRLVGGLGAKMLEFNALKAKIELEGLNKLDHPELRRPLPFLPHRIGIVTAAAGAVIHDMCDVLTRRFPNVEIRLYPCKVQGEGAAETIVEGIRFFNQQLVSYDVNWVPDVLIVGRGGGSMEDLWAYNEEPVIRAVAESKIPVISAVGHESDTTLCDYVADLRAGTPSIAAEHAVPVKSDLVRRLADLRQRLAHAMRQALESRMQDVDYLSHRLATAPDGVLTRTERRLDNLRARLALAPGGVLTQTERRLDNLRSRLATAPMGAVSRTEVRLASLAARLAPTLKAPLAQAEQRVQRAALRLQPPFAAQLAQAEAELKRLAGNLVRANPYEILKKGYSVTRNAAGAVVRSAADVKSGETLTTQLGTGTVTSVAV